MGKKKLIAGPFIGEFGFFLFTWQGRLRWLAHNEYDEVVVICRPGQEHIFEDFASEIIVWDKTIPDAAAGAYCRGYTFEDEYAEEGADRALPGQRLLDYNWRQAVPADPLFSEQEFILFGDEDSDIEGYDMLFHIRSTKKIRQEYKNAFDGWDYLLEGLKGLKVACIGTESQAAHIPGTEDRRGVSLKTLADIMRSSKVLVGPSSGPIHFAALCGLPQVTWVGRPLNDRRGRALRRYTSHWNPFGVAVRPIYDRMWNPSHQLVLDYVNELLKGDSK